MSADTPAPRGGVSSITIDRLIMFIFDVMCSKESGV